MDIASKRPKPPDSAKAKKAEELRKIVNSAMVNLGCEVRDCCIEDGRIHKRNFYHCGDQFEITIEIRPRRRR
jgi:hypothetical protein